MKFKCIFGHDWRLVTTNSTYSWCDAGSINLTFYQCRHCAKRRSDGDVWPGHNGATAAKERWELAAVLPYGSTIHRAKPEADIIPLKGVK